MSDSEQRDNDVAWLLAREKGQPGLSISEEGAARYERLEALIVELRATPTQPAGWHERMLAKLQDAASRDTTDASPEATASAPATGRRITRRRWPVLTAAAAAMAAAAAIVIYLVIPGPELRPDIVVSVEPGNSKRSKPRGSSPVVEHSVGDILVVRAVVGRSGGELRVYDDARVPRATCKVAGPGCLIDRSDRGTTLVLTMRVETPGTFEAVLFAPALGAPPTDRDTDVLAAMQAQHSVRPGQTKSFR